MTPIAAVNKPDGGRGNWVTDVQDRQLQAFPVAYTTRLAKGIPSLRPDRETCSIEGTNGVTPNVSYRGYSVWKM
jgi:hypothetical protein